MFEILLLPFSYNYMFNAMWVSSLVGGLCAFLSAYLMLKGWSLIGDALSHSIVPGVAGAYMLGLPFAFGAFAAGGLAAGTMLFLNQRTGLKEDAIIGLIFTSFFGLGLFMVSLYPMSVSIQNITICIFIFFCFLVPNFFYGIKDSIGIINIHLTTKRFNKNFLLHEFMIFS